MHPLPYSPSRFIGQIRCCYRQIEARLRSRRKVSQFQEAYLLLEVTLPVLVPIGKQRNRKYQVCFQPLAGKGQLSPETP